MLMGVVLVGLGNADGRKAAFDKRDVVAAAAVSVSPVDHHYAKIL